MRTRVAATACATLVLSYLASLGVATPIWVVVPTFAFFCYVVFTCGDVLLRAFHISDLTIAASWSLGLIATALALSAIVLGSGVSAAVAFFAWAVLVLTLDFATRRRELRAAMPQAQDLIGFLFCCAFTAAWCKGVAAAPKILEHTGRFPAWVEYFMHAGVIAQLGDERAIGRGMIWLVDTPLIAYHYSSYAVAAVFAWPLDIPGLPAATSIWMPLGFLTASAAAYVLGTCFAGGAGGLAALLAIWAFPDPSNYGLRNGFFSFHWILTAIPGSPYGLASALLAIAFLQRWSAERTRKALAASALLVAATLFVRLQVFLLLAPAWMACVAYVNRIQTRPKALLVALAVISIGLGLLLLHPPELPSSLSWAFDGGRALDRFLFIVHKRQEPTAHQGWYAQIQSAFGEEIGLVLGAVLVYPMCLGAFLLLLPLVDFLHRRAGPFFSNAFPLILLLSFGMVMALAPIPAHGDATEYMHRSFFLLYATVAIWTLGLSIRLLYATAPHGHRLWQMVAVASLVALSFIWTAAGDLAKPKMNWARLWVNYSVPHELLEGAAALRSGSKPGDVFAMPVRDREITDVDPQTILVALTGVPSYLARPGLQRMLGGIYSNLSWRRVQELGGIEGAADADSALKGLRVLGIRWYLVAKAGSPAWDSGRSRAVWSEGAYALYDSSLENRN